MTYWIIFAIVVVLLVVVPMLRKYFKAKHDFAKLQQTVEQCSDKYCFLVDRDLQVKATNFYSLNSNSTETPTYMLGNVIHCQTACDSGFCGTGIACRTCPVRVVLKNSFQLKRNFNHVTAQMHLYDDDHQVKEVDVNVDGQLVYVGFEPHFIVKVSKEPAEEPAADDGLSTEPSKVVNAQEECSAADGQTQ